MTARAQAVADAHPGAGGTSLDGIQGCFVALAEGEDLVRLWQVLAEEEAPAAAEAAEEEEEGPRAAEAAAAEEPRARRFLLVGGASMTTRARRELRAGGGDWVRVTHAPCAALLAPPHELPAEAEEALALARRQAVFREGAAGWAFEEAGHALTARRVMRSGGNEEWVYAVAGVPVRSAVAAADLLRRAHAIDADVAQLDASARVARQQQQAGSVLGKRPAAQAQAQAAPAAAEEWRRARDALRAVWDAVVDAMERPERCAEQRDAWAARLRPVLDAAAVESASAPAALLKSLLDARVGEGAEGEGAEGGAARVATVRDAVAAVCEGRAGEVARLGPARWELAQRVSRARLLCRFVQQFADGGAQDPDPAVDGMGSAAQLMGWLVGAD